jgi:hypothetical protein
LLSDPDHCRLVFDETQDDVVEVVGEAQQRWNDWPVDEMASCPDGERAMFLEQSIYE